MKINLQRARRDPVYFSRKLLRYDPHVYQARVLRDEHPTTVFCAGRGTGKTLVAVSLALWRCFTQARFVTVFLSNRMAQAKYAADVGLELLRGTPLWDDIVECSTERIKFKNGSTIFFVPGGSPMAARGYHNRLKRDESKPPGLLVVIDESAIERKTILVSGGERGLQIQLAVQDLIRLSNARTAHISS